MSAVCQEVPTVEECRAQAQSITNACLRECVVQQCQGVRVECSEYVRKKCREDSQGGAGQRAGFVFRREQDCGNPKSEIFWCELPLSRECRAKAMVHELAHSCGWRHGEGQGVPANNGKLECL